MAVSSALNWSSIAYPSTTAARCFSNHLLLLCRHWQIHHIMPWSWYCSDAETPPAKHCWQKIFQSANLMQFPLPLLAISDRSQECFELFYEEFQHNIVDLFVFSLSYFPFPILWTIAFHRIYNGVFIFLNVGNCHLWHAILFGKLMLTLTFLYAIQRDETWRRLAPFDWPEVLRWSV